MKRLASYPIVVWTLCAAASGCGLADSVHVGDSGRDGGDAMLHYDSGSVEGSVDNPYDSGVFPSDASCGNTTFAVHPTPPNVLVLLDRSCSMRAAPTGGGALMPGTGMSKWEIAVASLSELTTAYAAQVHWGLIYLPRGGTMADGVMCGGTPVCGGTTSCPEVAPGASHAGDVMSVLGTISPFDGCGGGGQVGITPLDSALTAAGMVDQLHDAARADIVLLVTDGEETCLSGNATMIASQLGMHVAALAAMHIKTAVVGFGAAGGGVNPTELNAMAMAGGLAATGATHYYAATDATSLHAALDTIIGSTLSCSFTLSGSVDDPSTLHVYVNGSTAELPRDTTHASGWDYDPGTHAVTVYGATCDDVHHDQLSQLDVVQSCNGAPPPPPPGACHVLGQACTVETDCCGVRGFACDTVQHLCVVAPG